MYQTQYLPKYPIEIGAKCLVELNGTTYESTIQEYGEGGPPCLGNRYLQNQSAFEDTGEPFFFNTLLPGSIVIVCCGQIAVFRGVSGKESVGWQLNVVECSSAYADASITCPKNALLYILQGNVRALDGAPMESNVELITLLTQSMNQVPVQGTVPFNIIEP